MIHDLKRALSSSSLPFGVDLALPSLGPTARKTNHDYTHGQLDALIDVVIHERATLFVSAVGVPPKRIVDRLHAGGVLVMNMVGKPHHAEKAFEVGCDIVCAQGGEGGGHTGEIPAGILVPACIDVAKKYNPAMLQGATGIVVAAGGIVDGRGLASSLCLGAQAVWVGTRFVASVEAGCSQAHKEAILAADFDSTLRTLVVSGRPLRVMRNPYIDAWEARPEEIKRLTAQGIVPMTRDLDEGGGGTDMEAEVEFPYLMGQVAAL
ncbi:MAG: hypothetical protein Q9187_008034, partial [Circinaria calcarea]